MLRSKLLRAFAATGVFALGACSSGGGTTPGGITLNISAGTLDVIQGAAQSLIATIGRTGDFDGSVTITIEGLPTNVTAVANPATLQSGATTTEITFTAGAGAMPGTTTVTIRASGSGVGAKTRTVALTVTSSSAPGYAIGLSPAVLSIQQGQQSQSTVTLTRTGGFAGNVQFSATGPDGVTVTFSPAGTTANSTTVTVVVGAGVAAQTYQVTIRGTASGLADVTTVLTVTVTTQGGGGGGGSSTSFRLCGQDMLFAAYQDGSGPWTAATVTNNTITFNMGARGAVAYVVAVGQGFAVNIMYSTQNELNNGAFPCTQPPATKTIHGNVANVPLDAQAAVALGTSFAQAIPALGTGFTLFQVPNLAVDLIAARMTIENLPGGFRSTANKIIVRRNQNPAANAILPVLDFNAAEAVTPVMRNLTVQNLGSDVLAVSVAFGSQLATQGSTSLGIFSDVPGSNTTVRAFPAFPNAGATDLHGFSLFTTPVAGATRALVAYYRDGIDRTVALGPNLGLVTVTAAATAPSARLRLQYTTQAEYNRGWATNYQQGGGATFRSYTLSVTPGYHGASNAFDYTMPDLAGLTGWNATWGFLAGQPVQWGFTGTGGGAATGILDGSVAVTATRSGQITP